MSHVQSLVPELPTAQHPTAPNLLCHSLSPSAQGHSIPWVAPAKTAQCPLAPPSPSHSPLKPSASLGGCALKETEITHHHVLSLPWSSQYPPTCPCALFHLVSRAGLFKNNCKCHASFHSSSGTPHLRANLKSYLFPPTTSHNHHSLPCVLHSGHTSHPRAPAGTLRLVFFFWNDPPSPRCPMLCSLSAP